MNAPRRPTAHRPARTATAALLVSLIVAAPATATPDPGVLQRKLDATQQRAGRVRDALHGDQARISAYQGRIDELEHQLAPLDASLDRDAADLHRLQAELRSTRADLVRLRKAVVRDQRVLAAQLVAQYEAPRPGLVDVAVESSGFPDLLSRVGQLKQIAARNAAVTDQVRTSRAAAARQSTRLAGLAEHQRAIVATETAKRDAVAHLKLQVVEQQVSVVRARNAKSTKLAGLRRSRATLTHQLVKAQRAAATLYAAPASSGGTAPSAGFGFFPASGTNYSVADEPKIAAHLETMAKALHLHLIGLSGYRTPAHSVEVGGFANDPHTRGQASDTPGLEGVPEATLNSYGLTRPFAGAAEADHVQLRGSI